ncbi:hypothetical protein ASE63_10875 [Bosea sp. Root381]|uniref:FadR/GntR family transcriptional regulator n=1 Tax=Bosea sp. Root381 TaxID=1736524 RepID=UPI0006F31073|nr:FadR/GntR family transcriptional regulator [Bosea sp. Root381]KRD99991.1 hypothetical protein ASE63_10875 [Bosea sp. Root381]
MALQNTRHQDAVDSIARWIVRNRFGAEGTLPNEADLGAELGVSRTVVREAVRTLTAKGMVSPRPRHGTRIQPLENWQLLDAQVVAWRTEAGMSPNVIGDLIDFRLAIEPFAAERAAKRTDFPIAVLEAAYTGMAAAADLEQVFTEADLAFHATILRGTQNSYFTHLIPFVENALRLSFRLSIRAPEDAHRALPFHRAVIEAIAARDSARAREAMTILVEQARTDMLDGIAED